jgi:hypothetical protein
MVRAYEAFSQGFLERNAKGWSITAAGRAFLEALEGPLPAPAAIEPPLVVATLAAPAPVLHIIHLVGRRDRKPRRRRQRSALRLSA